MFIMETLTTVGVLQHYGVATAEGDVAVVCRPHHSHLADAEGSSGPDARRGEQGDIVWPTQVAQLNKALLPPAWRLVWFAVLVLYLYPDVAIYAVFIPDTVQVVFPHIHLQHLPWFDLVLRGPGVYYGALALAALALTPLVFGTFKGTTGIQIVTCITRNALLGTMIVVAIGMATGVDWGQVTHAPGDEVDPAPLPANASSDPLPPPATLAAADLPWFNPSKVPLLFGGLVYATIHQQYIGTLLAPMKNKTRNILPVHIGVLAVVTAYYIVLCVSAVVAFAPYEGRGDASTASGKCTALTPHACGLQELYTFNFGFLQPRWAARALAMAPLLGMVSVFPIISITLRDNLMLTLSAVLAAVGGVGPYQRLAEADPDPASRQPEVELAHRSAGGATGTHSDSEHAEEWEVRPLRGRRQSAASAPAVQTPTPTCAARWAHSLASPSDTPLSVRVAFGLLAVVPAYITAAYTRDIDFLLRIVGCYGGTFIAFCMPCVLVHYARQAQALPLRGFGTVGEHPSVFHAPAQSQWWTTLIAGFAGVALVVNTYTIATDAGA